jgi:four helix bundle protein
MTPEQLRKRTAEFAVGVAALAKPLFSRPETRSAASQLTNAASSVAANYRVAGRARSRAEFVSKIVVVLEEADEAAYWLEHLVATSAVPAGDADNIHREALELVKIFAAARRTLDHALPPSAHRPTRRR